MDKRHPDKKLKRATNIFCLAMASILLFGCNEDEVNSIKEDPYAGGREPLTIKLLNEPPAPESAGPKDQVTFKAAGLSEYIHEAEDRYDFQFYISDELCEIEEATDSTVTVIVPDALSSGPSYMVVQNQIFYGPYFKVLGSVTVDEGFRYSSSATGVDGVVYQALPWQKNTPLTNEFYLCGDFFLEGAVVDRTRWGGVSMINNEKGFVGRYISGKFYTYRGIPLANRIATEGDQMNVIPNEVRGMEYLKSEKNSANPHILIYGSFTKYQSASGTFYYTNHNMAILGNDFSMPLGRQTFYDSRGAGHNIDLLTTFMGGADNVVVSAFSTSSGDVVAVGNFRNHVWSDYENSSVTAGGNFIEEEVLTPARNLMRMNGIGELDKTYRRDPYDEGQSLSGTTGIISDACMLDDESIVLVGEMSDFDKRDISNIVKVNADGTINETFLSNIGTGANGPVRKVNSTVFKDESGEQKERIVIVGNFTEFNGVPARGFVMMNADGITDTDFVLKEMEGGFPNFAKIVDLNANGDVPMPHVIMSGTFNRYDRVTRRGFLVLDMNGDAIQRFNVPGEFGGELYDAQYSLTSDNANGLLIVGNIYYFDGKSMGNMAMLKVELEDYVSSTGN